MSHPSVNSKHRSVRLLCMALLLALMPLHKASGQVLGVKTNVLYLATTTPNLGFELKTAPKWSVELTGGYNRWDFFNNIQVRNWMVQAEGRYWLCDVFEGHFFGLHAQGGQFNLGGLSLPGYLFGSNSSDYRYYGMFVGGGVSYGYQWVLGNRWSLEATAGLGYNFIRYEKFDFEECGWSHGRRTPTPGYFGPTKLGISFVYLIK